MHATFVKLFEHNRWANLQMVEACLALTEAQLDAAPDPSSPWTVRHTLHHLVEAEEAYLRLLTLPLEARADLDATSTDLRASAEASGAGLLALVRSGEIPGELLRSLDGYEIEPWVALLQAINHATEHRRQLAGMLRALGETPPSVDGWTYGGTVGAARKVANGDDVPVGE